MEITKENIFPDAKTKAFFTEWLNNGFNATKAYMKLHPGIGYHSARTLGSKMLTKVDIPMLLMFQNLGLEVYFQKLKEGLGAMMLISGKWYPDHQTRRLYHRIQGKLLGFE